MASDILLYQASLVPVGADQKQHLELARNLAQRFNNKYSDTFIIPDSYIGEKGSRIMSLQNPHKKMSKSDNNLNSIISLLDKPSTIQKKINMSVTDSGSEIKSTDDKPGITNLINIYSLLSDISIKDIENKYIGKMYSDFKKDLSEIIIETLKPIRNKYSDLMNNKDYLSDILNKGKEVSNYKARKTMSKVYKKIGFIQSK